MYNVQQSRESKNFIDYNDNLGSNFSLSFWNSSNPCFDLMYSYGALQHTTKWNYTIRHFHTFYYAVLKSVTLYK